MEDYKQLPERAKASIIAVVGLLTDAAINLNLSPGPELRTDPWRLTREKSQPSRAR